MIFIDEVDSFLNERKQGENESSHRVKNQFLIEMSGLGNDNDKVVILAATNMPWDIDAAARRRFKKRIYIPLPDQDARKNMF